MQKYSLKSLITQANDLVREYKSGDILSALTIQALREYRELAKDVLRNPYKTEPHDMLRAAYNLLVAISDAKEEIRNK